jgi:hypothetical protein
VLNLPKVRAKRGSLLYFEQEAVAFLGVPDVNKLPFSYH